MELLTVDAVNTTLHYCNHAELNAIVQKRFNNIEICGGDILSQCVHYILYIYYIYIYIYTYT